jgi:hypothetical protein
MNYRGCAFAICILASGTCSLQAAPNDAYCSRYIDQMDPRALYVATCLGNPSCLSRIESAGDRAFMVARGQPPVQLQRNRTYRFLYKTPDDEIVNSLVVIQLMQIGSTPRKVDKPVDVQLAREALNFACRAFRQNIYRASWPADVDEDTRLPTVDYDKYDQFHREGYTSLAEAGFMTRDFHTQYFDGDTCVSTLDPPRRSQFLLFARRNVETRVSSFFNRFGAKPDEAIAAPEERPQQYERLKVLLSNYQKQPHKSGCFSFNARGTGSQLQVSFSDLEDKVRHATFWDFDRMATWTFDLR